jgi:hypothetical protein
MLPIDVAECPFCLGRMQLEDCDGESWMVCPNGCPTELPVPAPELPVSEAPVVQRTRAAGFSK